MTRAAIIALFAAAALADALGLEDADRYTPTTRTSAPRGPGHPYFGSWTWQRPLPKPASQAKRRRLARRRNRR